MTAAGYGEVYVYHFIMTPPTLMAGGIMFSGRPCVHMLQSSFGLYLLNQLKDFDQIVHEHSVSDIDKLIRF